MLNASVTRRLQEKFPDLDETSSASDILAKINGIDILVGVKNDDESWSFYATGQSVQDEESKQSVVADLLLSVIEGV